MIRDLLNPSSGFLDLREDSKGEILVAGITEVSTINAREVPWEKLLLNVTLFCFSFTCKCQFLKPHCKFFLLFSLVQIMELLMKGNKQRTQEPTAANQTSSRSHAVLQVAVRQQSRCRDILQEVRYARLFMIDLAGSERASQVCESINFRAVYLLESYVKAYLLAASAVGGLRSMSIHLIIKNIKAINLCSNNIYLPIYSKSYISQ